VNSPLRFTPFLRPMVWGGQKLADALGKSLPATGSYGESWEVSDHELHRSVVAEGAWAGRSLRQLMQEERPGLLGAAAEKHRTFPWLVKFLDCCDWLSVQVHPDEEAVRRLRPGEGSKTEAWFVLDAAPGSRIYAGLLPGVDEKRLRDALAAVTVADCLHQFTPRPGDCLFLPAGTVHAVGGGVLMAEVQQTSDATFRLFDWNRRDAQGKSRTLHIEESLASIHWNQGPVTPVKAAGFADVQPGKGRRQTLVRSPYFVLEYEQTNGSFGCGGVERLQLLLVLQGRGKIAAVGGEHRMAPGQAWVLPATMPRAVCHAETTLKTLLCTLP